MTRARLSLGAALIALVAAPFAMDRYLVSVCVLVFWSAYAGQAWNVMMGFTGLLSLGHSLYIGLGAYTAAALFAHFGISPLLGLFPAMAVCVAAAFVVSWLGFRFRIEGVYFSLLTIAFAEVARIGFDHLAWTGAAGGFFLPVSQETANQWWNLRGGPLFFYYLSLGMALAALAVCAGLRRSRLGYQWLATREDAEAARAVGIDVTRVRILATLVSGAMTSLGGVFYAFYYNNLFPAQIFDMSRSIDLVLAPIVGGIGTLFGPIVGALILVPLGEVLNEATGALGINAPGVKAMFYGAGLMIIIALAPGGVWPAIARRLGLREDQQ